MAADRFLMNRIHNSGNRFQGDYKRVLCVCSAGLLRSPTTAFVLSQEPYNCNTRAAGLEETYALVPVDQVLLGWADEIVCMSPEQEERLKEKLTEHGYNTPVICLDIPDQFEYRNPKLIAMIKEKYDAAQEARKASNEQGPGN